MSKAQKVILWVAIGVVGALVLILLFVLGQRVIGPAVAAPASAPSPSTSLSPTPTPSPMVEVVAAGPVAPGEYSWDELLGGECLQPYESPWAEEFTVVDCATPHAAQLVHSGEFAPVDGDDLYPGADALQAQAATLCGDPAVITFAALGALSDVVVQASFAPTEAEWADDRTFSCFVSRASGEPLTGSIAASAVAG